MNIFKSLSQGNGSISETNITSFLSFLLNSTNEFDNSFVVLFLELIDRNSNDFKIKDLLKLNQNSIRERVIEFSKKYSITAVPEYPFQVKENKQIVDIFLRISNKSLFEESDIAFILIENKIKPASINKFQLSNQYTFFKNCEEFHKNDLPVISLLVTSDNDVFMTMKENGKEVNSNTVWLKWTNINEPDNSVEAILREMLIYESRAEIQPINPNSQFILKSFIDYIVTEYANLNSGQRNFSFNGSDVTDTFSVTLNGVKYILRRYENKMIRVFDENDSLLDLEVRPLLREINKTYKLNVDLNHSTGTIKNTQIFGRDILIALNKLYS